MDLAACPVDHPRHHDPAASSHVPVDAQTHLVIDVLKQLHDHKRIIDYNQPAFLPALRKYQRYSVLTIVA